MLRRRVAVETLGSVFPHAVSVLGLQVIYGARKHYMQMLLWRVINAPLV